MSGSFRPDGSGLGFPTPRVSVKPTRGIEETDQNRLLIRVGETDISWICFFPNSHMSYISSWWLQNQVVHHESNVYVFIIYTKKKSLVPQHSPSTLREHTPPVALQKGLPASLERRMLYLAFGYPRGAPPCLSGMFWVFAGVEVEAVWRRLKVTRIWNEQWKKSWSLWGLFLGFFD